MSEPLTPERFRDLADAYGGVIARWPEQYRDAATAMSADPAAREILSGALWLDDALDTWRVDAPTAVLREQVIGSLAATPRKLVTRARLWWSSIGIAAALAGAGAGTAAVSIAAPVDPISDSGTSFGDVAGSQG